MANDLKASVTLTADTSGLMRGLDGAMQKLNQIGAASSISAGFTAGQQILDMAQRLLSALKERSDHFSNLALQFSPEAARASLERQMQEFRQNQQIGQTFGSTQAAIERARGEVSAEDAARVLRDAEGIAAGMVVTNAISDASGSAWEQTKDTTLTALGLFADPAASSAALSRQVSSGEAGAAPAILNPLLWAVSEILGAVKEKGD